MTTTLVAVSTDVLLRVSVLVLAAALARACQ